MLYAAHEIFEEKLNISFSPSIWWLWEQLAASLRPILPQKWNEYLKTRTIFIFIFYCVANVCTKATENSLVVTKQWNKL